MTTRPLRALQEVLRDGRLAAAVRRREHGDALDEADRAVKAHGAAVERLEALTIVAPAVAVELDPQSRENLRSKLRRLRGASDRLSQETTTQTLRDAGRLLADVEALVQDVSAEVQRAWRRRVQRELNPLGKLSLTLVQLKVAEDLALRMSQIASSGRQLEGVFPPRAKELHDLQLRCQERDAALAELSRSGAGVTTFLYKVAESKATMADVDEQILSWLRRERALERFSIRL